MRVPGPGSAELLAAALAFVAGFSDGQSFIRRHLFGANMTGNTVLLGIALTQHDLARAAETLAPIVAFCAGCAVAFLILRAGRPPAVPLVLEALTLAGAAFLSGPWQLEAIAFAMGIQSSSVMKFGAVSANTSFVTGDYNGLISALVGWLARDDAGGQRTTVAVLAALIAAYGLAAACAALTAPIPHALLVVVPIVLIIAYFARRGAGGAAGA